MPVQFEDGSLTYMLLHAYGYSFFSLVSTLVAMALTLECAVSDRSLNPRAVELELKTNLTIR